MRSVLCLPVRQSLFARDGLAKFLGSQSIA